MSTATRELEVALGERSYPIIIGPGVITRADLIGARLRGRRVQVVTNTALQGLGYPQRLTAAVEAAGIASATTVLPDGEQFKTLETCMQIYSDLLANHCDRTTTLIAVGGGVVGDMTGFAAATYQRGVDFIQVPTTLLAQVDSSVGGKTGVNHPLGKNMIGAFHQPRLVLADTDTLGTLPDREFRAGLAEVVKYGLIRDAAFFAWLEENMEALLRRDPAALAEAILVSCRVKAEIVAEDETEQGNRALLNLGHTFGHAIEAATGYSEWLHGEAVAMGMLMAAWMSRQAGLLPAREHARIEALMQRGGLDTPPPADIAPERYLALMRHDKKSLHGRLRLILLEGIGRAVVTQDFREADLRRVLEYYSTA